jgi:hypothetical protein
MRSLAVGVLALLGACDLVFKVNVPAAADGRGGVDVPAELAGVADFDGDMIPDTIDNCPLDRNGPTDLDNQADFDGDGVGDDCDPDKDHGREHLVAFDPLSVQSSSWGFAGSWSVAPTGGFVQSDDSGFALALFQTTVRNPFVEVQLRDLAGTGTAVAHRAGAFVVTLGGGANPSDGVACVVALDTGNGDELVLFRRVSGGDSPDTTPLAGGGDVELRFSSVLFDHNVPANPLGPQCISIVADTTTLLGFGLQQPVSGQIGLWTDHASATFLGVMILDLDPTL